MRATLVLLARSALGFLVYLIAATPPTANSYYPKCVLYQITGLHCPGCGTGRAAHHLLNGHILNALQSNLYSIIAVPILAVFAGRAAIRWVFGRPAPVRTIPAARWIRVLLIAIIAFWILRNIPAYPFTLLAPVELG